MDPEREELEQLIEDWNTSRLDIFAISKPDENLDFYGVMRFYFQEPGAKDRKVATKCIRVNSSDTTEEVMKVLVSKFHPDLKMLTMPNYSLYEVHETGAEVHKLEPDQKPLYVQLYWQQSDRDGRFLLKSEDDQMTQSLFEADDSEPNFERRLSKREKKELKKKRRELAKKASEDKDSSVIAKELYGDRPSSLLTRSLSNPEAVMRMRRKKRLEEKLQLYSKDPEKTGGGGGPLRIFAESLQPEIPYKTLLFASDDTTETVLKTALEKYEVPAEEMDLYCLTMVTIAPGNHSDAESPGVKERVVHEQDCPLAIAASWPENKGELRFYLKKRENMPKRKQKPPKRHDDPARARAAAPLHSPSANEHSPPPAAATLETSFDVTENSPQVKEAIPSPVHIVDSARDLPATLEFRESGEDAFFAVVVSEVNGLAVHFKLAPTYTLYMCCRYRLSPKFRPDFPPNKRREKVAMTAKKVANMMWQTVKENNGMAGHLAFWMANSSEFLHFLKQDAELSTMTEESQKILAHTTQQAFRSLVQSIKAELQGCLPAFLDPSDESNFDEGGENEGGEENFDPSEGYRSTERSFRVRHYGPHGQPLGGDQWMAKRKKASRPVLGDILHTLSSAMSLLRRCRVNAALTIQLFSQLFHYMNMWLFNRMVLEPQLGLCTRAWGSRLLERLGRIQDWAEHLGLELAAECHLGRATQAAFLLQVPKQDSTAISSHCYKLNSLQLRQLLEFYQPERDEPAIPLELIDNAVAIAESTADALARSEGQEVRLEEEPDLHLPFLLPEDGYSSELIRGVPPGLREFLEPLITPGLCRLTIQPKASGLWTVHFKKAAELESPSPEPSPDKEVITINKGSKGMGVSIVAAKGVGQERSGIYVKEIVEGGPADLDGRLKPGDQILDVNGESLVGVQQEDAVKYLIKSGSVVNMTISKRAVWQHGLAALLNKPAVVNKPVEAEPTRSTANQNVFSSPKKDVPRAPPRYRPPQDSLQRSSPPRTTLVVPENTQGPPKPEPRTRRRSPYDGGQYNEWKSQVRTDGGPEQTNAAKPVVEYQLDDAPVGRKPYAAAVPYASPQEIQRRQKEMQQRKVEEERREQEQENFERERIKREREEREGREQLEHERIKREREEREGREQLERERIKREHEEREQREHAERERIKREREEREHAERERFKREELARRDQERKERERMQREELERQERERIDRERMEREELERKNREEWEKRERERIQREELERKNREEWEKKERERIQREELERKNREEWEKRERERIQREELERKNREEWEKKERERIQREEREWREREEQAEREKRMLQERKGLDELSRRERELELMIEQRRREKEKRLQELERQLEEERAEAERMEQEYREQLRKQREERTRENPTTQQRNPRPAPGGSAQVHYLSERVNGRHIDENKREMTRAEEVRANQPGDYGKRPPPMQNVHQDSFDMDPVEIEKQFQERLAKESATDQPDGDFVTVIRVPVQDNWESRGGVSGDNRDTRTRQEHEGESTARVRVDWQRGEDDRNRKEMQWRREQDEQLMRDYQQQRMPDGDTYRQPPAGSAGKPIYLRQPGEWEKDEELRRQREEDDRLREARDNQLRNRIIEKPEDDEDDRNMPYNGRTRRVKFASVRTEIIQPPPDAELSKVGVKFVHDGKVEDSDEEGEEFPRPPPPIDQDDEPPPHPPPPEDGGNYYQRPQPPPKPQYLVSNNMNGAPPDYPSYRDNEVPVLNALPHSRMIEQEMGYATYPGRQPHNNNYPVPKPRVSRNSDQFIQSPSPDQAKLPFKDKMKMFNETTPPKKQTTSRWERDQKPWMNGDSL